MPELISPDGRERKRYPAAYAQKKIAEGWTLASGQEMGIETEYGKFYAPAEQAMGQMPGHAPLRGGVEVTAEQAQADWERELRRREYEGRGLEALLAGAGRGLTFGATDILLPEFGLASKETLAGLKEFEPGMSTTGELGAILAGGIGSLGKGAIAKGLRATPVGALSAKSAEIGARGTKAFIAANAAEGAIYGIGQKVSELALTDQELAAETYISELLQGAGTGALVGGAGAGAFKLTEKAWKAGKALRAPKAPPHLDIKTPEGAEFLGTTARSMREVMRHGDDLLSKTSPSTIKRITPDETVAFDTRGFEVRNSIDDALRRASVRRSELASQRFDMPEPPKGMEGLQKPVRAAPELPEKPIAPVRPSGDPDELAGRILELEDELAAAATRSEDPFLTGAAGRRKDAIAADKTMRESAFEREMAQAARDRGESAAAKFRREKIEAAALERGDRAGSVAGGRPVKQIEAELEMARKQAAALTDDGGGFAKAQAKYEKEMASWEKKVAKLQKDADSTFDRAMAKYEKDLLKAEKVDAKALAEYEKQVEVIEGLMESNKRSMAELDDAIATMASRGKSLKADRWEKGAMFEKARLGQHQAGEEIAEELGRLRHLIGDDPADIKAFADASKQFKMQADEVAERLRMPINEEATAAREALEEAVAGLKGTVGDPTAQNFHKLLNAEPDELANGLRALDDYTRAMQKVAATSGDKAMAKAVNESLADMQAQMTSMIPEEVIQIARTTDAMDLAAAIGVAGGMSAVMPDLKEGPWEEMGTAAAVFALLRRGHRLPQAAAQAPAKAGGAPLSRTMAGRMAASGAAGTTRSLVPGGTPFTKGVQYAASTGSYQVSTMLMNKLGGARGLQQLNGRSTSQIVHAIDRLVKKAGRTAAGGKSASAVLKGMKFLDDRDKAAEKQEADLKELFKKRTDQLRQLAADPQRLKMGLWEATKELRGLHPEWADKVEVGMGGVLMKALDAAPKDPGGYESLGGSTWQPDDFQVQQYANVMEVLMNPMSAISGVADGTLTHEGAQALREMYPATFRAMQAEVASRAGELAEALTFDEENRLSILMGVPINAMTTPEHRQFIAETYASRQQQQAESMGKVDANALQQEVPTQAQQLLNRGKR